MREIVHPALPSTFYSILGVEENATLAEMRSAHRKRVLKHHPDRGGKKAAFLLIQQAWEILRNVKWRETYDLWLAEQRAPRRPVVQDWIVVSFYGAGFTDPTSGGTDSTGNSSVWNLF